MACLSICPIPSDANPFWSQWSDGKAEVSGYALTYPRYGQSRVGYAVLVYVTEPFSRSRNVKVDNFDPANPDHFTVLKLNRIERFQTGIYDYSTMSSVFTDPNAEFRAVKATFSSQEWCGQTYEEVLFDSSSAKLDIRSYFEGETKREIIPGILDAEEGLWVRARGLDNGGPGQFGPDTFKVIGNAMTRRLKHQNHSTLDIKPTWSGRTNVTVPAGTFDTKVLSWVGQGESTCQLFIEVPPPHKVIKWTCSDGQEAVLTGTKRIAYWQTVRPQHELLLKELGLEVAVRSPQRPTKP